MGDSPPLRSTVGSFPPGPWSSALNSKHSPLPLLVGLIVLATAAARKARRAENQKEPLVHPE